MKSHLVTFLLQFSFTVIGLIPRPVVGLLAQFFGWFYALFPSRDRKLIEGNIKRVYGLAPHSNYAKVFRKQVLQSQFAIFLETIKDNYSTRDLMHIEGLEALREAITNVKPHDKGLMIVTAHLGSWESVAKSVAKATARRFYALGKPSKVPEFTKFMGSLRERTNTEVLWTDSKNLLRDMMKVLKSGEALGFVMDQKPEGRVGPIVSFMGQNTEFVAGPAKLAIRHQCPVLAVFCMRTGPWHYKLIHELIVPADHGQDNELILTQSMASAIERCVRVYPEQWVWNYKRWRTAAASSKDSEHGSPILNRIS